MENIKVCTLEIKAWRCSIIWEEENRVIHGPTAVGRRDLGIYVSADLKSRSAVQTSVDVSRTIKECATDTLGAISRTI